MTEPVNPAARVRTVIDRARSKKRHDTTRAADVWAEVLEVSTHKESPSYQVDIGTRLVLVIEQVEALRVLVPERTPLRPERYEAELNKLVSAFSPARIIQQWGQVSRDLTDTGYAVISMVQDLLGDLEPAIPAEALERLLSLVEEAEKVARTEAGLSTDLRIFILRSLAAVRAAIEEYPLRGVEGLKHAARTLTLGIAEFAPDPKKSHSAAIARLLMVAAGVHALVNTTGTFIDNADHIRAAAVAIYADVPKAAAALKLKLPAGPKLLGPGTPDVGADPQKKPPRKPRKKPPQ